MASIFWKKRIHHVMYTWPEEREGKSPETKTLIPSTWVCHWFRSSSGIQVISWSRRQDSKSDRNWQPGKEQRMEAKRSNQKITEQTIYICLFSLLVSSWDLIIDRRKEFVPFVSIKSIKDTFEVSVVVKLTVSSSFSRHSSSWPFIALFRSLFSIIWWEDPLSLSFFLFLFLVSKEWREAWQEMIAFCYASLVDEKKWSLQP